MSQQNLANLEAGQYRTFHQGSTASYNSGSFQFNNTVDQPSESSALLDVSGEFIGNQSGEFYIRKRINSLTQVGGVNSIENFARSWTRAATFIEATPQETSFILEDDPTVRKDENSYRGGEGIESNPLLGPSTLRTSFEVGSSDNAGRNKYLQSDNQIVSGSTDFKRFESWRLKNDSGGFLSSFRDSNTADPNQQGSSPLGSYGASYEALQSNLRASSMGNAGCIWRQQQTALAQNTIKNGPNERAPVVLKEVEQDGKIVLIVAGQSTLPQTIFNSTNVLVGIGILSLPLGFKYAGWVCGIIILSLAALVTSLTAKLLAKCMDLDRSLITFADIALISFGERARNLTSLLFTLELVAACVGSIVLFSDTLDVLIPGIGVLRWKIFCGMILIPLNFLPLRFLSFTSVIGIFSCLSIISITFIDGFIKPNAPGSLRQPSQTYLFPENWRTIPLSIGLFMSPWGGHSVFPNIYRDMRHPRKYSRAVKITFSFTYLLDLSAAVSGILMFGDKVSNEISANLLNTSGYPRSLSIILSIAIAIIPITKIPLNCSPLLSTAESFAGLRISPKIGLDSSSMISPLSRDLLKASLRIALIILFVLISIVFPFFDSIMAFMGSALCTTVCVILPPLFYLKLFGKEISTRERVFYYFLIAASVAVAFVGTIAAFLPKSFTNG